MPVNRLVLKVGRGLKIMVFPAEFSGPVTGTETRDQALSL